MSSYASRGGIYEAEEDEGAELTGVNQPMSAVPPTAVGGKDLAPSTVSLSGLLNAIDGVSSQVCTAVHVRLTFWTS